jgi:hypothetical protein
MFTPARSLRHISRTPLAAWAASVRALRSSVLFLTLGASASACATVAPYERERLAQPDMELGRSPDAASGEEHATAYREGSTGAMGTSGGGCGCN